MTIFWQTNRSNKSKHQSIREIMKTWIYLASLLVVSYSIRAQELYPFEQDQKWGFRDQNRKVIIAAQFGSAETFSSDGLAKVGKKEGGAWKYGIIDRMGKIVIPITYDKLGRFFYSGLIVASQNGKFGFLDKSGKVVVPLQYQNAQNFTENLAAVQLGGKWGFIDPSGTVRIPIMYDFVTSFDKQHSKVTIGSKTGFIDSTGKNIGEIKYDDIVFGHIGTNLYGAKLNGKYAVLNRQGKELTGFIYDEVKPNYNDQYLYIILKSGDKWCVVNDKGSTIIPALYNELDRLNDKLLFARNSTKWGIINLLNTPVLPIEYTIKPEVKLFRSPQGTFIENGKRKSFYVEGDQVRVAKYDHIDEESEGRRAVYYQQKAGFVNNKGEEVVALKYDSVGRFFNGLAPVASGGKFGYVDTLGKEKVAIKYEMLDAFYEGLALVASNNKWGFVDETGREVIPLTYQAAGPFVEGLAAVMIDKKIGFIDHSGKMIIQPQFDGVVELFQNGQAIVIKNGKEIRIDKSGNAVSN